MNIGTTIFRLLSFRLTKDEMLKLEKKHFYTGLIATWIVGMGRYWDDQKATLLQHLGIGSVIYIFILAAFIWIIIKPLRVEHWTYFTVLTFISLTSFPAIFYAIPVETFLTMRGANAINAWFLAVVALWRLCMLYSFLKRFTQLDVMNIITITLLPICIIITTLTILNLHHVVFQIMGGLEENSVTPHDTSYGILILLTGLSMVLIVPLLIAYGAAIYFRRKNKKEEK